MLNVLRRCVLRTYGTVTELLKVDASSGEKTRIESMQIGGKIITAMRS
jgi:hypothetical protein